MNKHCYGWKGGPGETKRRRHPAGAVNLQLNTALTNKTKRHCIGGLYSVGHHNMSATTPPLPASPWQAERLSQPPVLATYHQEHPDRAAQAEHILHVRRQSRKCRAPLVVPEAPSPPPIRAAASAVIKTPVGDSDRRVGVVDAARLINAPHFISVHFILEHFIPVQFIPVHFVAARFFPVHFIPAHFISGGYIIRGGHVIPGGSGGLLRWLVSHDVEADDSPQAVRHY